MKAQWQAVISGILLLITGIFVLVSPSMVIKVAVIIYGIYTIIESIYALALTWKIRKAGAYFSVNLLRTLLSLVVGIIVVYFAASASGARIADWTVYLIATWLLLSALSELLEVWLLKRQGYESYGVVTNAAISVVLALIMYIFPAMINNALFTILGIVLILLSVFIIVLAVRNLSIKQSAYEIHVDRDAQWGTAMRKESEKFKRKLD